MYINFTCNVLILLPCSFRGMGFLNFSRYQHVMTLALILEIWLALILPSKFWTVFGLVVADRFHNKNIGCGANLKLITCNKWQN